MLQEDHKRRVARLIRDERKVADLHNLFSDLRMHQPGRAPVQETGHFAAHRHERAQGISLTRANDILTSATPRSEERREGHECSIRCRARCWQTQYKTHTHKLRATS